jgi:L-ascorbate metabolism protein UlaG (beta-lactamase superfamily)
MTLSVRRLGWAGVEVESEGQAVVIDPLAAPEAVYAWAGERAADVPLPTVVAPRCNDVVAGLLTHLHRDHADAGALAASLTDGAPVLEPVPGGGGELEEVGLAHADWELTASGLRREQLAAWETRTIGPFAITALPAVDGAGDPQLSWLVEAEGRRVVHCGDTLFHGYWWRIAIRLGAPDVVFVPISGATNDFPNRQPASPLPAVMAPEQAALAGELIGAGIVVPMHYGGFDFAPHYEPVPNCRDEFERAAVGRPYAARVLEVGAALEL